MGDMIYREKKKNPTSHLRSEHTNLILIKRMLSKLQSFLIEINLETLENRN